MVRNLSRHRLKLITTCLKSQIHICELAFALLSLSRLFPEVQILLLELKGQN
jgi:hypothetical protein